MRRLSELVPVDSVVQPKFSIMRRSSRERIKGRGSSAAGSIAGEDADLSDGEPSEAGSLYSRSSAAKRRTLEEREAAYQEARSRIFMDFAAKARGAGAGTSAASSATASTSAGGSSADDCDAESVTTESEWSAPDSAAAVDGRIAVGPPGRSRSRKAKSARASRGTSPASFTYASIYEPAPDAYEPFPVAGEQPSPVGYVPQPQPAPAHAYPYGAYPPPPPPQAQHGPPQAYYQPYYYGPPYYPPGPEPSPPAEYGPPPPAPYPAPYGWPAPVDGMHSASPQAPRLASPPAPYAPGPYGAYAGVPGPPPPPPPPPAAWGPYGYYPLPPPGPYMPPPPPGMMGPPAYPPELARQPSAGAASVGHSRTSSRASSAGRRSAPPPRAPWGAGPDLVGPRFGTGARRLSSASSTGGARTPGDEASSTTVCIVWSPRET
jgi:hypothetical protein